MSADNDNRAPEFLAIFGTGTGIATILVFLRLWVRARIVRNVGADDWIITVSLILVFGSIAMMGTAVHYGLGRHTQYLTDYQAQQALKFLWVGFNITPSAEAAAKISITIMLMRITTSKKLKWFFTSLIILFVLITIASLLTILLSCHPIQLLWNSTISGSCNAYERTIDIYIQGVMAAAYDSILAISPIILLWNVQISRRSKWLLCGLLSLGFFTSAAGILRTVYTPGTLNTTDPTWAVMNFLIWKTVELPLSIIVGCLPTLRPLFDGDRRSRKGAQQITDNTYILTGKNRDKIRRTISINIDSSGLSTGDRSINMHNM